MGADKLIPEMNTKPVAVFTLLSLIAITCAATNEEWYRSEAPKMVNGAETTEMIDRAEPEMDFVQAQSVIGKRTRRRRYAFGVPRKARTRRRRSPKKEQDKLKCMLCKPGGGYRSSKLTRTTKGWRCMQWCSRFGYCGWGDAYKQAPSVNCKKFFKAVGQPKKQKWVPFHKRCKSKKVSRVGCPWACSNRRCCIDASYQGRRGNKNCKWDHTKNKCRMGKKCIVYNVRRG